MKSEPTEMPSSCSRGAVEACSWTCCLAPAESAGDSGHSNATGAGEGRSSHRDFPAFVASAIFRNSQFTDHESIPPLQEAFSIFAGVFPQYVESQSPAEQIRETEYSHLSGHVCLDYSGVGLFSHAQMSSSSSSSSSSSAWRPPFFTISYKPGSLKSEMQYGEQETGLESDIRQKVTNFLRIPEKDYGMVFTASRTAAFRLLAETFPFHSNRRLLTVYDYKSEAVSAMAEAAENRGATVMSASFSWPSMRINPAKLKMMVTTTNKKKRGLFVFPLMSRMTGVRYPYLWMKMAQENGWHVALDACTSGPKDMDTMGMTLIQPDFIICSFFKVFGENPSGFAGLFVKKSGRQVLEISVLARSIGVVTIVRDGSSNLSQSADAEIDITSSFCGPIRPEIVEEEGTKTTEGSHGELDGEEEDEVGVDFRGLHHADSLGLLAIQNRLRCIINWLVIALTKLKHPNSGNGGSLVKIYGPEAKFDRGSAIAFNVFDWKGEKVAPAIVQKLADRSNIALSCGFLKNIWFSHRRIEEKEKLADVEKRDNKKESVYLGIGVLSATFGFLANFEDAYKLWAFVAKFLDADFVEKERWRYVALNQRSVEI